MLNSSHFPAFKPYFYAVRMMRRAGEYVSDNTASEPSRPLICLKNDINFDTALYVRPVPSVHHALLFLIQLARKRSPMTAAGTDIATYQLQ